ncbi:MAG: protein-(glutamine-N5) methyltransferase, release factor-specific [Rhodospirillaceae bacterium]|nr:protein-(glutamine-N5) methyltransferase, release factor-specific [Rhodospirillaceae bacterium]|tara:strand:- start:8457 stop:9317 length:861 start_codon:yes stop_codon:yes gene_type:complete
MTNYPISKILNVGTKKLKSCGIFGARRDARILLSKVLGIESELIISNPDRVIEKYSEELFFKYISRRCEREPVSKIIGEKFFWKEKFFVNSCVLDPRPDSEIIIESVLKYNNFLDKDVSILDIGTGSGALLLSLLAEFPQSIGLGIDRSFKAIKVAKQNSRNLGLNNRANFAVMDWCSGVNTKFDIVISNPPYIPTSNIQTLSPEVRLYDPQIALNGGKDGVKHIETILKSIPKILSIGGFAVIEIGYNQLSMVEKKILSNHLRIIEIFRDLSGIDRCIVVSLVGK